MSAKSQALDDFLAAPGRLLGNPKEPIPPLECSSLVNRRVFSLGLRAGHPPARSPAPRFMTVRSRSLLDHDIEHRSAIHVLRHNSLDYSDPDAFGCNPRVASQPRLGLRPGRRHRIDSRDSADPVPAGKNLARTQATNKESPGRGRGFLVLVAHGPRAEWGACYAKPHDRQLTLHLPFGSSGRAILLGAAVACESKKSGFCFFITAGGTSFHLTRYYGIRRGVCAGGLCGTLSDFEHFCWCPRHVCALEM